MKKLIPLLALTLTVWAAAKTATDAARFRKKLDQSKQAEHLLSRATFGIRPGDVDAARKLGLKKWLDQQLNPQSIPENPALLSTLAAMPTLALSTERLAIEYPTPQMITAVALGRTALPTDPELRATYERLAARYKARIDRKKGDNDQPQEAPVDRSELEERLRRRGAQLSTAERSDLLRKFAPQQAVASELTESRIYRAVMSEHQLEEVLTDFWFNHFNVYLDKGADRWLTTSYERDAIRPHVLAKFKDLLSATAHHPAMLFYLDNWQSVAPNGPQRPRARGINENYARELMELHTLGVDGGYTQKDVQEVARCFTGWTIAEPNRGGQFRFAPRTHDDGEKVVLGVTIPAGGGIKDGEKVLDILSRHPSTARYIATRLAQRFVADNPPPSLIDQMASTFTRTDGDLKAVVRTMFESREFMSEGAFHAKIKSPLEMVAGALRATGATISSAMSASQAIAQMGQPLYRKQEPTGYSNSGEDWLNSAGLLARMNFAIALSENKLPGVTIDKDRYAAVARSMGAPEWQRR